MFCLKYKLAGEARGKTIDFTRDFYEKGPITFHVGPWRSLVARHLGVVEVAGSNPVGPTNFNSPFLVIYISHFLKVV